MDIQQALAAVHGACGGDNTRLARILEQVRPCSQEGTCRCCCTAYSMGLHGLQDCRFGARCLRRPRRTSRHNHV